MLHSDQTEIHTVALIGAGNLAWHLGHVMKSISTEVVQICSRNKDAGIRLANSLNVPVVNHPNEIGEADLYLICVSDDAIREVSDQLKFHEQGIVVHTAGSVSLQVLANRHSYGVLYPLQTFSKDRPVDFKDVPFLIEGSDIHTLGMIRKFALKISGNVQEINSEDRSIIHLGAVMASNFSNHLLDMAGRIMSDRDIPLALLEPLMHETISKAFDLTPGKAQTGPALRGNKEILKRHMDMLARWPEIREIYRVMSESILNKKANG